MGSFLYPPSYSYGMHANYDAVAGIYDLMARVVYGRALEQAQLHLVNNIPPGAKVLIVGGGTGWILEALARRYSSGLQIVYVEVSGSMLSRARKRTIGQNQVAFIGQAIQNVVLETDFDVIITPFVLDNFTDSTLAQVFQKLDQHLRKKGLWLFADFQLNESKPYQKILLESMYLLFRITCKLEAKRLPDTARLFAAYEYRAISQQFFYSDFITSVTYQKH